MFPTAPSARRDAPGRKARPADLVCVVTRWFPVFYKRRSFAVRKDAFEASICGLLRRKRPYVTFPPCGIRLAAPCTMHGNAVDIFRLNIVFSVKNTYLCNIGLRRASVMCFRQGCYVVMLELRRIIVWLCRIRRCRGFGIQSPWAYRIVRYVINEHYPYYAYGPLSEEYPAGSAAARKRRDGVFGKMFGARVQLSRHTARAVRADSFAPLHRLWKLRAFGRCFCGIWRRLLYRSLCERDFGMQRNHLLCRHCVSFKNQGQKAGLCHTVRACRLDLWRDRRLPSLQSYVTTRQFSEKFFTSSRYSPVLSFVVRLG